MLLLGGLGVLCESPVSGFLRVFAVKASRF